MEERIEKGRLGVMSHGDGRRNGCFRPVAPSLGGPALRQLRLAAVVIVQILSVPGTGTADDVTPRVSPDRIQDVHPSRSDADPFATFDNFSWRAFIALNWPSFTGPAHRGQPDRSKKLDDSGPRVWETFKAAYEVFPRDPEGRTLVPAKWDSYDGRNPCGAYVDNRTKTLHSFSEFSDFNQASFVVGQLANPLVAQNRTYTRYEMRFNREEFDSIAGHKWYIRRNLPTRAHSSRFNAGSTEVKAAWRILTDQDTPAVRRRYYVVKDAWVLDVARSLQEGTGVCSKQDVALVGLHIVVKTAHRPQWIWASFEHVDNVPPIGTGDAREPDAKDAHAPYSYNDPSKPQNLDPPSDSPLLMPIAASNPPKGDPEPMQVVRQHPISPGTMEINRAYWALPEIRDTVWANYMLVVTQWPTATRPNSPTNDGQPVPIGGVEPNATSETYQSGSEAQPIPNLANTTMETYQQSATASCMACHHVVSNALGRDFVAFISREAGVLPPVRRPAANGKLPWRQPRSLQLR